MVERAYRLLLGTCLLLIVDCLWVVSSEVTEYLYNEMRFPKPFFATYVKTSMFSLYLVGLMICSAWKRKNKQRRDSLGDPQALDEPISEYDEQMVQSDSFEPLYAKIEDPTPIDETNEQSAENEDEPRSPTGPGEFTEVQLEPATSSSDLSRPNALNLEDNSADPASGDVPTPQDEGTKKPIEREDSIGTVTSPLSPTLLSTMTQSPSITSSLLSDSMWVPIKFNCEAPSQDPSEKSSGAESDEEKISMAREMVNGSPFRAKPLTKLKRNWRPSGDLIRASQREEDNGSDEDVPNGSQPRRRRRKKRHVRFNKLTEVRQLPDVHAEDALWSRLSYAASLRVQAAMEGSNGFFDLCRGSSESSDVARGDYLSLNETLKLAVTFCLMWFAGNVSYQIALYYSEAGLVNVLSSTSSLIIIPLTAIFPTNSTTDRFSLTKLIAVIISIGSIAMITSSPNPLSAGDSPSFSPSLIINASGNDRDFVKRAAIPSTIDQTLVAHRRQTANYASIGALWSLSGAFFYAAYVALLRHRIESEDKLNFPLFFGFVGVFNTLLLWPGFLVLHFTGFERFLLPTWPQLVVILVNGLIGTLLSELLWLWGCFLTSSLMATLSTSLTIPLTVLVDILLRDVHYSKSFFIGASILFFCFIVVTLLSHFDRIDPVANLLLRLVRRSITRRGPMIRHRNSLDAEQSRSLIQDAC